MKRTVSNVTAAASGQWDSIFPALGIDTPKRGQHGPCPVCGGDDRFHFDDKEGRGTWHCRGCEPHAGDGLDLVQKVNQIGPAEAAKMVAGYLGIAANDNNPAMIERNRQRAVERKQQDEACQALQQQKAARQAVAILDSSLQGEPPYLTKKGFNCTAPVTCATVRAYGEDRSTGENGWINFPAGSLVIAAHDAEGNVSNVQLIDGNGSRAFLKGKGTKQGKFHRLEGGQDAEAVALVEGYATGLTVSLATGWPVYVAFDKGNMQRVIDTVAKLNPGKRLVICADNDAPGQEAAQKAAARVPGAIVAIPDQEGMDWDDYRQAFGLDATSSAIRMKLNTLTEPANDNAAPSDLPDPLVQGEISEDALALIFERRHSADLRYCHTAGAWFVWTGSRWQRDNRQCAFNWAREVCRDFAQGQVKFSRASVASAVERFAIAAPSLAVDGSIWDQKPWLIATPGGVIDLRTGQLRPAEQNDYITRSAAVTPEDKTPVRWLAFLKDATRNDAELIRFLQQMAGYCLTGATAEHALFFIYGAGGNGKSVFLNTLTAILGEYAQTAAMDTFTASKHDKHPTDLAMLKGARLVTASETEDGRAWAEAKIKQMTGGDPITARFMRRDFFTYTPEFKLVIVGNHKPQLNNVDDATKRRFNIIPFIHKPTEPNPDLERSLREEWPAILNWMVQGAIDWQQNGLVRPPVVVEATQEYFEEQDLFGQWLNDCCEQGSAHQESSKALFANWRKYAEAAGDNPGSAKSFGSMMRKRGFPPFKNNDRRGFKGVRVKPEPVAYDPRDPGAWD